MYKSLILTMSLATIMFSSCTSDELGDMERYGSLNVTLNVDESLLDVSSEIIGRNTASVNADEFNFALENSEGVVVKTWEKYSELNSGEQFKIGSYKLTASHGDVNVEGFENPCYQGMENFEITEASITNVDITCTLINSMVSISYTDAFKGYFSDYEVAIHSEGNDNIVIDKEEVRACYMKPGNIYLSMKLVNQAGTSSAFSPGVILTALPQHHYKVKLDVNNGNMGVAQLIISFDDAVENDDVVIDLSDELMSSPAPEIIAYGFTPSQPLSIKKGQALDTPVEVVINARGGLKEVYLTADAQNFVSAGLPTEMDLMKATDEQKSIISQLGIDVKGLWNNPETMAKIDFSQLLPDLNFLDGATQASFKIVVVDKYSKQSEPLTLLVVPAN